MQSEKYTSRDNWKHKSIDNYELILRQIKQKNGIYYPTIRKFIMYLCENLLKSSNVNLFNRFDSLLKELPESEYNCALLATLTNFYAEKYPIEDKADFYFHRLINVFKTNETFTFIYDRFKLMNYFNLNYLILQLVQIYILIKNLKQC